MLYDVITQRNTRFLCHPMAITFTVYDDSPPIVILAVIYSYIQILIF